MSPTLSESFLLEMLFGWFDLPCTSVESENELDDLTDQFLVAFRDGKWTDALSYHEILDILCNQSQDEEASGPDDKCFAFKDLVGFRKVGTKCNIGYAVYLCVLKLAIWQVIKCSSPRVSMDCGALILNIFRILL